MAEGWMGSTGRPQLCSALLGLQLSSPFFSCLLLQCEHCTLCSVAAEEKGSSPRQHLLSPRSPPARAHSSSAVSSALFFYL